MITLQKSGKKSGSNFIKRASNIVFYGSLNRTGLSNANPNELLINQTNNEGLYIEYPGLESTYTISMLWDCKPILKINNMPMRDLTFVDIWKYINEFIHNDDINIKEENIVILSRIFYKMAFLNCHTLTSINNLPNELYIFDINTLNNREKEFIESKTIEIHTTNSTEDISFESFLMFYDLLCTNEDCKYYYKSHYKKDGELKDTIRTPLNILNFDLTQNNKSTLNWVNDTGRINSLLTHINILKNTYDNHDMFDLLYQCSIRRGIFSIKNDLNLMTFLNQNN